MSARNPDLPNLPSPECAAAIDVLQRRLDGDNVDLPPVVALHIAACRDCRGRFAVAERLIDAVHQFDHSVPSLLTERIIGRVVADGRRRRARRWSLAAVGMAAGVAAAIWLARPPVPGPELARNSTPPPDLRQDFTDAGEAVAALTRRAAVDAVAAGRQLVSKVPPPAWPPALEPARPFEEAGAALADGFEPVATSARRAALLFWRDLPSTTEKVD